jgi:hypothetical protein
MKNKRKNFSREREVYDIGKKREKNYPTVVTPGTAGIPAIILATSGIPPQKGCQQQQGHK